MREINRHERVCRGEEVDNGRSRNDYESGGGLLGLFAVLKYTGNLVKFCSISLSLSAHNSPLFPQTTSLFSPETVWFSGECGNSEF